MFLAQISCINLFHVQDSDDEDQNVPARFLSLESKDMAHHSRSFHLH